MHRRVEGRESTAAEAQATHAFVVLDVLQEIHFMESAHPSGASGRGRIRRFI